LNSTPKSPASHLVAVIISYFPDIDILRQILLALDSQVDHILVVDNGSLEDPEMQVDIPANGHVSWLLMKENLGVAKAQNIGIARAREHGATHVLLLDQDSIPFPDMASNLLSVYMALGQGNAKVAAVGPVFLDQASGQKSSFVRFGILGMRHVHCDAGTQYVHVDILIASGSLIAISALDAIGDMEEGLFIDYIDTEWILRARMKGYMAYGACNALMFHELGSERRKVWLLRWRHVPIHRPLRFYYIFRNGCTLMLRKGLPVAWKRCELINLIGLAVMFSIFVSPRLENIKMMIAGVLDGIRGKAGKFRLSRKGEV
jgi:rhamnosyltransferase